jgi:hypothetical protein
LKKSLGKYEERGKRDADRNRLADVASALTGLFNDEERAKDVLDEKWFKHCQTHIPVGRDMQLGRDDLMHYYFAQVASNLGGDVWNSYRTALFDHLQSSQNKDGSWPASSGIGVGPVYATALWCSVLQLEKRGHPSRRRVLLDVL